MSDTPRTDIYVLNALPECVAAAFARDLERELTETKRTMEARYDCHGGPGTTQEACETCTTCLLRELENVTVDLAAVTAERDALQAKVDAMKRMIDVAEAATDAQTDLEVATSASFNEAMALEYACLVEGERDAALAALRLCRDAVNEGANHLYDSTDMGRVRGLCDAALAAADVVLPK